MSSNSGKSIKKIDEIEVEEQPVDNDSEKETNPKEKEDHQSNSEVISEEIESENSKDKQNSEKSEEKPKSEKTDKRDDENEIKSETPVETEENQKENEQTITASPDEPGDNPIKEEKESKEETIQENQKLDNVTLALESMDEKYKTYKKNEEKKEKIEEDKKVDDNRVDLDMEGSTNPVQGQPHEEENEGTYAEKKVQQKIEELKQNEKIKETKKTEEENSKYETQNLEYIVPEMSPLEINNYHENSHVKSIEEYTQTEIVEQISQSVRRLAEENNKNKHYELGRIYRLYKLLPFCLQRAIESCQPKMKSVKKVCENFHKKDCFENDYVVRLHCMEGESYFNGACYKDCPEDMKDSKVACIKDKVKKRRVENLEDPIDKDLSQKFAERYLVTKCSQFGPSYVSLGPDLCIQECPYGWKDFGKLCLKPVRYKNQKAFFYDSSMN